MPFIETDMVMSEGQISNGKERSSSEDIETDLQSLNGRPPSRGLLDLPVELLSQIASSVLGFRRTKLIVTATSLWTPSSA